MRKVGRISRVSRSGGIGSGRKILSIADGPAVSIVVTTKGPHGITTASLTSRNGILISGSSKAGYNVQTAITSITSDTVFVASAALALGAATGGKWRFDSTANDFGGGGGGG